MRLPFAAASVSQARHRLKDWLVERNTPAEAVEDARVVISELVANSVRHAQALPDGNLLVKWEVEDRGLQLSVTDGGATTRPRTVHAASSALSLEGRPTLRAALRACSSLSACTSSRPYSAVDLASAIIHLPQRSGDISAAKYRPIAWISP